MSAVNARHLLVTKRTEGKDPLVDSVIAAINACSVNGEPVLLANTTSDDPLLVSYKKAMAINDSSVRKLYVESCLIASQDLQQISDLLGTPVEVLNTYRKFFYDIEGFDKLSLLEVIDKCRDANERGTKTWALTQGLDFMGWRLGRVVNVNPIEGLKELFTLCMYKSKEALFSGNASESSKEATKWTKLAMDQARLLKMWVMDNDAAKRDIELAIASVTPDFKGFDTLVDGFEGLPKNTDDGNVDMMDNLNPDFDGFDSLNNEEPGAES